MRKKGKQLWTDYKNKDAIIREGQKTFFKIKRGTWKR